MEISTIKEQINNIQKKYGFKKVILFGSRANGTNKEDSDIDLLVEFEEGKKSLFALGGIKNDIEEKFKVKADVFFYPIDKQFLDRGFKINNEVNIYG